MNWYSGNITEAVTLTKVKNAIFVVYIEGKDELSQKLSSFIDDEKIKSKLEGDQFVAIKIEGGSTAYMQFTQIYQLVPLPSLFFISENGTPLEIATGVISSVDELRAKIENVLKLAGFSTDQDKADGSVPLTSSSVTYTASSSTNFISNQQVTKDISSINIVCGGDVCYKKVENKDISEKFETEEVDKQSSQPLLIKKMDDIENKEEHTRKCLNELKKKSEEKQDRLDREREIRRRKGQEMQNTKKNKLELELQQLKEEIQIKKSEKQAAHHRILEKIATDRADRARKTNLLQSASSKPTNGSSTNQKQVLTTESGNEFVRIQFRKQSGESETHNFKPSDQFKLVRNFVRTTLLDGKYKEFTLATTFPRCEFTIDSDIRTLKELDLYPSAVLLVLIPAITSRPAAVVARSGGLVNIITTMFWGMLSPVFYFFNYFRDFITGKRPPNKNNNTADHGIKRNNSEFIANEISKKRNIDRLQKNEIIDDRPSSGVSVKRSQSYRRIGNSNVHRLHDQKDSDDENNTWNGNSTQQQ